MWQEPFSLQRPECISRHITHYVQNRPGTRPFLGCFGPRLWATRSSTSRIGTKPSRPRSGSISSSGSTDTRFETTRSDPKDEQAGSSTPQYRNSTRPKSITEYNISIPQSYILTFYTPYLKKSVWQKLELSHQKFLSVKQQCIRHSKITVWTFIRSRFINVY